MYLFCSSFEALMLVFCVRVSLVTSLTALRLLRAPLLLSAAV